MSRISDEIRKCMLAPERGAGEGCFSVRLMFPKDFIGFQGHFPENPILPGVCKIQAVLIACRAFKDKPVRLREVLTAKFWEPVADNEELRVDCRETCLDNGYARVNAVFWKDGKRIARIDVLIERNPDSEEATP